MKHVPKKLGQEEGALVAAEVGVILVAGAAGAAGAAEAVPSATGGNARTWRGFVQ